MLWLWCEEVCWDRLRLDEALRKVDPEILQVGSRKSNLNGWLHVIVSAGQHYRWLVIIRPHVGLVNHILRGVMAPFRVVNQILLHRNLKCFLKNTCGYFQHLPRRLHRLSVNLIRLRLDVVDLCME
jgi:hypothetical protein